MKNSSDGKVGPVACQPRERPDDAQVIGEAQGDDAAIQKFLKDISNGPSSAHVVKVENSEIDSVDGESSFETR